MTSKGTRKPACVSGPTRRRRACRRAATGGAQRAGPRAWARAPATRSSRRPERRRRRSRHGRPPRSRARTQRAAERGEGEHGLEAEIVWAGRGLPGCPAADRARHPVPLTASCSPPPTVAARLELAMRARLVLVALAALSTACKDSNQPPTTGALRVSVATTGIDVDPNGYRVTFDLFSPDSMSGGAPVGLNGSVTITLLLPGSHTVGLGRVPSNCGVGGSNPRSVKISAGDTVTVAFTIVCRAAFGSIAVAAVTSGTHLDPDGYTIEVDGILRTLAINETTVFDGVRAGPHSVTLDGVATNCSVAGDNPRTVMSIAGGDARDTVRTTFQVSCVGSGSVRATTTTTGADLDPDGYSVRLQKLPLDTSSPIPANGTVSVSGLPLATYSATLVGV